MAINKIKIGSTEHELQTTIPNVTGLQSALDGKAASSHNHAASNITSGTLSSGRLPTVPIAKGGTGATTAAAALTNLGITATATELNYVDGVTSNIQTQLNGKASSSHTHSYLPLSGGNLTGTLGIGNKYELSPAYNYTNGCLIDIAASKASTMVAIHITGNSYSSSTLPINSLFQFYDYGDGSIMNYSGVNLGLGLGAMTVYRYNGRLYAYIKQKANYQTLEFTIITNKPGLSPAITNAAAHTSGYTDLVTITPQNVATVSHTHTVSHTPAGTVSKPAFTGSAVTSGAPSAANSVASSSHTHSVTAAGSVSQPTFTGTEATISADYTPAGTVSKPTFTGSAVTSGTPSGGATVASSTHTHKYTPAGIVSQPTFTGTEASTTSISGTTSVYSITGVGSVPSLGASVSNKRLTLTFSAGSVPTRRSVTVASSGHTHEYTPAGTVSTPTFTGTQASTTSITGTTSVASNSHTHSVTASGSVTQPTFTGTEDTISASYTPAGTVSKPTFTGSAVTSGTPSATTSVASNSHTHSVTASGSVSQPTFTGTAATLTTSSVK